MPYEPPPGRSQAVAVLSALWCSRYLREPLIILAAYIPYFLARGHAVDNASQAFINAQHLMQLETSAGIFKEVSVQSATISYSLAAHLFNIVYFYGHWPVI